MKIDVKRKAWLLGMILAITVVGWYALRWTQVRKRASFNNVLLITIDCLRYDYLTDPSKSAFMPTVRNLTRHGISFQHAYAQSDLTTPATNCLLSSRFIGESAANPAHEVSLQRRLYSNGFRTCAFLSTFLLRTTHVGIGNEIGFETYDCPTHTEGKEWRRGELTTEAAVRWLRQHTSDPHWFMWVMYWDIHQAQSLLVQGQLKANEFPDAYDAGASLCDASCKRLLEALAETGHANDTLVVLTANHGFPHLMTRWNVRIDGGISTCAVDFVVTCAFPREETDNRTRDAHRHRTHRSDALEPAHCGLLRNGSSWLDRSFPRHICGDRSPRGA